MATVHVAGAVPPPPVRVVVVAATIARARQLERLLDGPGFAVVGVARGAEESERLVAHAAPAAVLIDLDLPAGGLEAIERIMATRATPIVVVGDAAGQPEAALAAGAVDVVGPLDVAARRARVRRGPAPAPGHGQSRPGHHPPARPAARQARPRDAPLARPCLERPSLRAAMLDGEPSADDHRARPRTPSQARPAVVAIGASTGGPPALATILRDLPADLDAAVLVVQHMAEGFVDGLARWLDEASPLPSSRRGDGDRLRRARSTWRPPGGTCCCGRGTGSSSPTAAVGQFHVPGVDATFQSVASGRAAAARSACCSPAWAATAPSGLQAMREAGARHHRPGRVDLRGVRACRAAARALGAVDAELPLTDVAPAVASAVHAIHGRLRSTQERASEPHPVRRATSSCCATTCAQTAGLEFDESRRAGLAAILHDRIQVTGAADVAGYLGLLDRPDAASERQRLLDAVTIQETHFHRARPQIDALRHHILPDVLSRAASQGREAVVWSAGCSTGEEPFTLAMLMLEVAETLPVRAADARGRHRRVVRRAAGRRRLRRTPAAPSTSPSPPPWSAGCGATADGAYVVRDEVRDLVEFAHHNLVTDPPPFPNGGVDLVVCRHVTIYFSRETTRALVVPVPRRAGHDRLVADGARRVALAGQRRVRAAVGRRGLRLPLARSRRPPGRPGRATQRGLVSPALPAPRRQAPVARRQQPYAASPHRFHRVDCAGSGRPCAGASGERVDGPDAGGRCGPGRRGPGGLRRRWLRRGGPARHRLLVADPVSAQAYLILGHARLNKGEPATARGAVAAGGVPRPARGARALPARGRAQRGRPLGAGGARLPGRGEHPARRPGGDGAAPAGRS